MSHSAEPPRDPGLLLSALIRESQELRSDVVQREERHRRETAERERRQKQAMLLIGAGLLVCLVLIGSVVVLLVQSRQRGNDTRALIRANAEINQQIADCTTRGKPCYEEGAQRSAALIRQLLEAQKQISLCRSKTEQGTTADLERCIDLALAPIMTVPTPIPTRSTP